MILFEVHAAGVTVFELERDAPRPIHVDRIAAWQLRRQPGDHEGEQNADELDLALNAAISRRFLRLDPGSVERLGRYETALWRQVYQVIFVLNYLRRQDADLKWLPRTSSSVGHFRPLRSIFPKD